MEKVLSKEDNGKTLTFEEAVRSIGVGKYHYFLLLTCGTALMYANLEISGISIIMLPAKCDLKFTALEKQLFDSVGLLGVVISSQNMGLLADSHGRIKILRTTLLLSMTTSFLSAFSVNTVMLICLRFLTGVFMAGVQCCMFTYLGEFHSKTSRTKHLVFLSALIIVANVYFPAMGMVILPLDLQLWITSSFQFASWRLLLLMNMSFGILSIVGLFLLPESPKYLLSRGNHDECLNILRRMHSVNNGKVNLLPCKRLSLETNILPTGGNNKSIFHMLCGRMVVLFHYPDTFKFVFISFTVNVIGTGVNMWLPEVLVNLISLKSESLSVCETIKLKEHQNSSDICTDLAEHTQSQLELLAYISLFVMAFYLFTCLLVELINKKCSIIVLVVISSICSLTLYWNKIYYLTILALGCIVSAGNLIPVVRAIANEYFPTQVNAVAMSLIVMVGRLGSAFGTFLVGNIQFTYCNEMYFIFGALTIVIGIVTLVLPKPNKAYAIS